VRLLANALLPKGETAKKSGQMNLTQRFSWHTCRQKKDAVDNFSRNLPVVWLDHASTLYDIENPAERG
jgi:hypothetical protein